MKFVIILSIVAVTLGKDFEMKLDENGEKFVEKVKIDVAGKTEEIKVPKHGNRAAIDVLNDFNVGYSARKVMVERICYISAVGKDETPAQMERSMEKSQAKFPTDTYMVHRDRFVRLYEMTSSEVGAKIAAHCAGYKMILTMNFKKDSDVLKALQSTSTRSKRAQNTQLRLFTGCDSLASGIIAKCPRDQVDTRCQFRVNAANSCVYRILCRQVVGTAGTWSCIGEHKLTLPFCCDFTCRVPI